MAEATSAANAATTLGAWGKDPIATEFQKQLLELMRSGDSDSKAKALEIGALVYVSQMNKPSIMEQLMLRSFGLNTGGRH